jgi:hypothetical protein
MKTLKSMSNYITLITNENVITRNSKIRYNRVTTNIDNVLRKHQRTYKHYTTQHE